MFLSARIVYCLDVVFAGTLFDKNRSRPGVVFSCYETASLSGYEKASVIWFALIASGGAGYGSKEALSGF